MSIFKTNCLPYRMLKIGETSKKRVNWTWGEQRKDFLLTQKDALDATMVLLTKSTNK